MTIRLWMTCMKTMCMFMAVVATLSACSPGASQPQSGVAQAYEMSEAVVVKPYTRTIFSSTDF